MSVSREQLVRRAGVDDDYVRRLHQLGALRGRDDAYEERDVHVAALLYMWERAGLSAPAIIAAVDAGTLSLDFLDSPAWELPEPLLIGLEVLSTRPASPSARYRASHLNAVRSDTPTPSAAALTVQPSKRTRSQRSFLLLGQVRALPWIFTRALLRELVVSNASLPGGPG